MQFPDLQLDWLKCFVAVVDSGSLSGAAPQLHRSQSAISMKLQKLEQALDAQLLVRGPREHQLTAQGELLLGYARQMLDLHAQTQRAFHRADVTGTVRLGVPDDYARAYLTPVLRQFAQLHQSVEIELVCEQSPQLIPKVEQNTLDIALISRDSPNRGTLLFHEPVVWVQAPQLELWRREPLPIAVYESENLARHGALKSLAQQGRGYKVVYSSSSLAGHIAAVESGLAVAVLTKCSVPDHLDIIGRDQGLGPLEPMQVSIYRSENSHQSAAVDSMYHLLLQTLRQANPGV
ncbi:MAG: LysR family transcriptional regulator [Pseudomonadales bacterium]